MEKNIEQNKGLKVELHNKANVHASPVNVDDLIDKKNASYCSSCGRFLGHFKGQAAIKCHKCKQLAIISK